MSERLRRTYLNVMPILAVFIILFLTLFSYLEIRQLREANQWVIHTHEIIETTADLLNNISFAESGQRGYLLTNDKSYIASYSEEIKNINRNLTALQNLVHDNLQQFTRVLTLSSLLKERIDFLNYSLALREKQGPSQAVNIMMGQGQHLTKKIREIAHEIITEENKLLTKRSTEAFNSTLKTIIWVLLGNFFSLAIILFYLMLLNKQLNYRQRAEKQIRDKEQELYKLAYFDTLTDLPNRAALNDKIEQIINNLADNQTFALLLINIDNFKNINDSLGHKLGDELLIVFAERLGNLLPANSIISRIGGDEFVIVLQNVEQIKDIVTIVKKIQSFFSDPQVVHNHRIFVTGSIGISIYPNNGTDAKSLLKNADIAMYRAKELGKNNYQFCTPEMAIEVEERAMFDYHLHQALQREEFILLYQPKMSLADGKMIGVEALIRWNRPDGKLISPDYFISLAESNGLIIPISAWMVRTACYQMKKWQEAGLPIHNLAINVSIRQFLISDFVGSTRDILQETGLDPQYLELEITERILMENSYNNFSTLLALKSMGIKITIDDFGTGYSSLSYLRLFAIDKIKIDKSFLQEIQISHPSSPIINAIIVMAHSLGIIVVAEGVETALQAEVLKSYHCDEAQGFYYSHPLPAHDIEKLFTKL